MYALFTLNAIVLWLLPHIPKKLLPILDGLVSISLVSALIALFFALFAIRLRRHSTWPVINVMIFTFYFWTYYHEDAYISQRPSSQQIRVVSLNVGMFSNDTADVRKSIEILKMLNANIVVLQEFGLYYKWPDVSSVAIDFAEKSGYTYFEFTPREGNIFGTAIFTNLPILHVDTLFQSKPQTNEAKRYILQSSNGSELVVFNVHLESYNLLGSVEANLDSINERTNRRMDQANSISADAAEKSVTIIAGDFNASPGSRVYESLHKDFQSALNASRSSLIPTYGYFLARIDDVLFSQQCEIIETGLDRRFPSDHVAVVVDLYIP